MHYPLITSQSCPTKCKEYTKVVVGLKIAVLMAVWRCHVHWVISSSSKTRSLRQNVKSLQVSLDNIRIVFFFFFMFTKSINTIHNLIAAYPDVQIHDVDETWDFILLASDGIWDVLSNDDVVKLCLKKMEKGIPPEQICEEIMTECLSPDLLMTGTDNMTIVLTCFLHNKTYEDFCKRAADYCLRLFPDDEKFHPEKSVDSQSAAKYENGLSPATAVISHDDEDGEDSSTNSDDDQPNGNDNNGDADSDEKENENVNSNVAPVENGKNDEKAPEETNSLQESKKFKEEDVESEDLK